MYINGNLNVEDNVSGDTFNFKLTPTTNNTSINLLVRNSTTGNIEQRTIGLQLSSTTLNNWSAFAQTGILVRTAVGAWSGRTLTAPAAGITITNANGIAGNPTFALANDLSALEGLAGTGFAVRTGTDTWAQRSITGGTGIVVTNGTGTTNANVSISLPSSAITALNLWSADTGTNAVKTGQYTTASGVVSVAIGRGNISSGQGSFAGGYPDNAGTNGTVAAGRTSFSFQEAYLQSFGFAAGVYENKSAVLGGRENLITSGTGHNAIVGGSFNRVSGTTNSAIIGGSSNNILSFSNSVILGGSSITATDDETVYVPNFKTIGFTQAKYVSVGAASSTLPKQTSVVIATTTARGGSVTITLPASPVDGQIISFRRTDAIANTCTIAPNAGYTLNVNGVVGNYALGVSSRLRLVLVGTVWYDI